MWNDSSDSIIENSHYNYTFNDSMEALYPDIISNNDSNLLYVNSSSSSSSSQFSDSLVTETLLLTPDMSRLSYSLSYENKFNENTIRCHVENDRGSSLMEITPKCEYIHYFYYVII